MRLVGCVAALIFIFLGGSAMKDCASHEALTCDRSTGTPRCERVAGVFTSETTVLEGDSLAAIRAVRHAGKGSPTFGVGVIDRAGASQEVVHHVPELDARRAEAWFTSTDPRLAIEHPREPVGMAMAGGLIAIGVGFAIAALLGGRKRAASPA